MSDDMGTEPAEDEEPIPPLVVEESAELDVTGRQAEEASRSKIEFLDRMSHELRTPLNSVLGFTNVLLKHKKSTSNPRELDCLQRIRPNGMHLLDLVNDLLDLNRIEKGEMTVNLKDLDIGALIEETVDQLDDWGLKDNVKAHFVIPPHLDPIRADESRVRQVLRNLVGNAVKFTDEGSITVRVDAEGSTARRIRVEDTGVGVPPDRIKTIFMAFEQGDGAKTRAQQGSGLGLAISNALCEMMGMQLSVKSVLGEGSTFTVTLGG
jgi:signal transduction histidine kinase